MSRKKSPKTTLKFKLRSGRGSDSIYKSRLVSLFRQRLLKSGKASLARKIISEAFNYIEENTKQDPLDILREAVLNVTPVVEVKPQRRGGTVFQVPVEVLPERGTLLALSWIVQAARQRGGRGMVLKLAAELMDASQKTGNAVRKKEDLHRMADANKALSHYRF
uniref:Small ribosomal subunit protein uS7c n=1 Tax=Microrhizoidea pickettheapsiorum TaxID=2604950 RepID=A0A5B9RFS8_9CHLO|nr:ribosomal protein S7 [Microrhizoidea pickettheapsiorum]QEG77698.1 ribosomal protein S7 [Microrhizoidea pickettheapsiorum]